MSTNVYVSINWWFKCDVLCIYILARGVMVIVVGNGHGDTSSNPGRD